MHASAIRTISSHSSAHGAEMSPAQLGELLSASESFRTALGRLWWHADDAYLQGILSQCVLSLGGHAQALRAEATFLKQRDPSQPGAQGELGRSEAADARETCFEVQENTAALTRCVLKLGRSLEARYAAALASRMSGFTLDALREQQHELSDMLALVETTACWLGRKALLVDVALDDWLMAQPRRDGHRLPLPC